MRWIAFSGKFDRVQLGSSHQLERAAQLERVIGDSVRASSTLWQPKLPESAGVDDLSFMQQCITFLKGDMGVDEFGGKLMDTAAIDNPSGKAVCYIMRSLGCFASIPDGFNYKDACAQMIAVFAPWTWDETKIKCLAI